MERIRICHLITTLGVGGAERGVYELSRRLDRERFDVRVAALRGGPVEGWLRGAGIPVHVAGVRDKWDALKLPALAGLLRRERIDILHTHLFHADLAGRPAAAGAGVRHVLHTVWTAEGRFRPWQFAYARLLKGTCERIVCVSESVRRHHARRSGLPGTCYTVIPWGVDTDIFARSVESRRRLRREWQLHDEDVLAAFVGRLEFYKGVETMLAAMDRLASAGGSGVRLVVAGDGPQRPAVERYVAQRKAGERVRYLGHVEDVPALLSAADLYVMPSLWEGWPLALGEAMSASLPTVGSDVPGIRDLVVRDATGLLVPARDAAALAEAIGALAGGAALRARMGEAARKRIVECFSIDATVRAHEKLYAEIAALAGEDRGPGV